MEEHETIEELHTNLRGISSECFFLGEKLLEERLGYKVTAIDEANDVSNMKLDELIGSLRTFEMRLCER